MQTLQNRFNIKPASCPAEVNGNIRVVIQHICTLEGLNINPVWEFIFTLWYVSLCNYPCSGYLYPQKVSVHCGGLCYVVSACTYAIKATCSLCKGSFEKVSWCGVNMISSLSACHTYVISNLIQVSDCNPVRVGDAGHCKVCCVLREMLY